MGIKKFPSEGEVHVPPSTAPPPTPNTPPPEKCIFFALPSMNGLLPAELKFGENPESCAPWAPSLDPRLQTEF